MPAFPELAAFELASRHTEAVLAAAPDGLWDRAWPGLPTFREQVLHLALVRESICRQLAGEPTAGLGARFEEAAWRGGSAGLTAAFEDHTARCRALLARLDPGALDAPFTTPFGNRSTPRNYLRAMLLEEQHHRAQMTQLLRLAGAEPPPYPGQAWVELGVDQG
ncbi:MAG TPA: DinB family protein [Holophagaceae bacterium]|nr:DinB family protein [Holophagaceae bacterium]